MTFTTDLTDDEPELYGTQPPARGRLITDDEIPDSAFEAELEDAHIDVDEIIDELETAGERD